MTKKIKLNKSHRAVIEEWGAKHIASTIDRAKEAKLLVVILDGTNAAVRAKYPEKDMAVLRKYNVTRTDYCLRLQFPSGRVDGFNFSKEDAVADLPCKAGCYSNNDVFAVSEAVEKAFDGHAKEKAENDKKKNEKLGQFYAFVNACQTVEEVLDVIPLPDDVRKRLGHASTALVAASPESIKSLKATFKVAA